MLKMLIIYGIKPICIFDGWPLNAKFDVEKERGKNKSDFKELAKQATKEGNIMLARTYNTRALYVRTKQINLF